MASPNDQPSPELGLVRQETIEGILLTMQEKLRTVGQAPDRSTYNEFNGNYDGGPVRFQARQIPIEFSASYEGAIAILGFLPPDTVSYAHGITEYRFMPPTDEQPLRIEKRLPYNHLSGLARQQEDPDLPEEEARQERIYDEQLTRIEEKRFGLDRVDNAEAQAVWRAFEASREDPARNKMVRRLNRNPEGQQRAINRNTGVPNEPWTQYMGRRILRRLGIHHS